ncbi:MAG TPA: hypothetical protein QF355_03045 [Candidatus Marinimicrobia bacterium]|nr:hypothetical protein [Candidatus Neomarinimicrobiota bacterium]MDP6142901.1 hypothetical protein [Candidatus Neomarinimicrobiota bacterium]MDP6261079.1 hypothetical protein [Candidatus Neomarinimicrobiota bacterium]MDP7127005.1 hypothetical protein [Candidatus Neomarinimicrobiota bacterium]MDP7526507.1 hypothetical protein [Candidatus Neomarinimicrobiota bacterium]
MFLLILIGCKDDPPDRHLQLGNWYVQKGILDEAVLEFREVVRLIPLTHKDISKEEFKMLGTAHYNLALVYTKKGWWDFALKEAQNSFNLQPTASHYDLVQLIKKREELSPQKPES